MDTPYSFNHTARYLDIIVIDSDNFFCLLMEQYLKLNGFNNVHSVANEEAGLRELSRYRFDIVLLEACHEFRKIWEYIAVQQPPPFLLVGMTFDRNGRDWLTAFASGADAVLTKPFTRARLGRVLSDLLVSSASRRCKIVQHPAAATSGKREGQSPNTW
jgi:DNA-binding NtrC family response regulator